MRRQRKQVILATAVLVAFVALLAFWVGNPNKGHKTAIVPPANQTSSTPTTSLSDSTTPSGVATSPVPTGSVSGSGTTGLGTITLPAVSGTQYYGAGNHLVVIHVTSDSVINAVGYVFRNGKNGKKVAVEKDFTYTTDVEGGAPLAAVGAQVSYYGTEVTCSISVDGHVRITKTVRDAYHVVVCIA